MEQLCPNCDKSREYWSSLEGFADEEGRLCCCGGCAQHEECLCPQCLPTEDAQTQESVGLGQAFIERERFAAPFGSSSESASELESGLPSIDDPSEESREHHARRPSRRRSGSHKPTDYSSR